MPELPLEIWKDRIENELESLKRLNVLEDNSIIRKENSIELIVTALKAGRNGSSNIIAQILSFERFGCSSRYNAANLLGAPCVQFQWLPF